MKGAKLYGAAGAALILIVLAVVAWLQAPDSGTTDATIAASIAPASDPMLDARSKGSPDAPIQIYEMSDFQCPFCLRFFDETLPLLEAEYIATGKARLTFINLPLIQTHPNAAAAHEFAMCAAGQDQFWTVHDLLFNSQETWAPMGDPNPHFMDLAEQGGLDREALDQCLSSGSVRTLVAGDVQLAIRNRVNSTPTFIVEGGVLQGAAPIDTWRPILDSIYTAKTGGR